MTQIKTIRPQSQIIVYPTASWAMAVHLEPHRATVSILETEQTMGV